MAAGNGGDAAWGHLFAHVQAFDANADGFIDAAELKRFLVAVGAWESETVYTDAAWTQSWPAICQILGADAAEGLPLASFQVSLVDGLCPIQ
jgi:hypothetical protein